METVLKTVVGQLTVGSNPTPSAKIERPRPGSFYFVVRAGTRTHGAARSDAYRGFGGAKALAGARSEKAFAEKAVRPPSHPYHHPLGATPELTPPLYFFSSVSAQNR